jgi:hypothetical protein
MQIHSQSPPANSEQDNNPDANNLTVTTTSKPPAPSHKSTTSGRRRLAILDVQAGLSLCEGEPHLLDNIWTSFLHEHQNAGKDFLKMAREQRWQDMKDRVWGLKALCQNIGAPQLAIIVNELHDSLIHEGKVENEDLIQDFDYELTLVLKAIENNTLTPLDAMAEYKTSRQTR